MLSVLFGTLPWVHWTNSIKQLPYNVHIIDFISINSVIEYITNNKIDVLIGITKQQNFFIIDNYDVLQQHVKNILFNNNKNTIDLLNDKHNFYTFMKNNNFGNNIPITFISCTNNKQIIHAKFTFPCIYKLCISSGGASSHVIETNPKLCKALSDKTQNYVIQEYISGSDEYSGHLYVYNGIIKYSKFYHLHNDKKNYIQKGRMIKYDTIDTPNYITIFEDIFKVLDYTGFACIDYKIKNDSPKIFEINPRLGATIVCNIFDFCDMINNIII